ncbi:MAG: MMPL family transporter [Bdellovibrionota bacterium]
MMSRKALQQWIESLLLCILRHPKKSVLWISLTLIPSLYLCFQLTVRNDFKNLLPQNKPSVKTLDELVDRVGGLGTLIVAVEANQPLAIETFIHDLAIELSSLPEQYVRFLEYNVTDVKDFYTENRYFYVDLADLKTIRDRLKRKIEYEKLKQNPFFFELEEEKVEFDLSDIEKKYEHETSGYDTYIDGYFFSKDQKMAVMLIQPFGTATGVGFSKKLIAEVEKKIEKLNPTSYDPSMKIYYRGKYQRVLTQYSQLITDVVSTLAICFFCVALSLFLYFFRVRVIILLSLTLAVGTAWTFGISKLVIGYLNSQTAFLGSIIIGNGVNTGILLFASFFEHRKKGLPATQALEKAVMLTYKPTFIAAITTSMAFAALGFSEIKGFSHFGFIGGIGMMLCWIASYVFLPPLIQWCENLIPSIQDGSKGPGQWTSFFDKVYVAIRSKPILIIAIGSILVCFCIFRTSLFLPDSLEYDFSKLKTEYKKDAQEDRVDSRMKEIFPDSLTPSVLLIPKDKQPGDICEKVMQQEKAFPESERTIASCSTLDSYLPIEQDEKMEVHKELRGLLQDNSLGFVKGKYKEELEDFKKAVNLPKVTAENLPPSIRRKFSELDGTTGKMVYVFPKHTANLNNGKKLMQFSDALSNIRLDKDTTVRMSGESAIFADLLRAVKKDGPLTTLISFLFVSFLVFLNLRNVAAMTYVLSGLLMGMIFMMGMESVLNIKLNFFNFIALPVTFGIGVDYGVNFYLRYKEEGYQSVEKVLHSLGGAVALCSVTTIIGYVSLTEASSQALASFGWLALLGEIACIVSGLFFMPTVLFLLDSKSERK